MTRIFFTLASFSLVLLIGALMMGLTMGELYQKPVLQETLQWATIHRLTGVGAALAVVFVQSIVMTYFIGTSRWCKEVVDTYRLDQAPVAASNRLKRKTFPWALAGMFAVIGVASLGAAADPAAMRVDPTTMQLKSQGWAIWHLVGAFTGIAFVAWTYLVEWNNIAANNAIIEGLVAEVGRIRKERGLED